MSERGSRLFVSAAAAAMACVVVVTLAFRPHHETPRQARDVVYPHAGSCLRADAVTGPPCRAVRELLLGANAGDAPMYCRHFSQQGEYGACVKLVAFSDPGFSAFQTVGFRVKSARVMMDGVAVVRAHVWPFDGDGGPGDVLLTMQREAGWWRVTAIEPAPQLVS